MPRTKTVAERLELQAQAYELSVAGNSERAIAKRLKIAPNTVRAYLDRERTRIWEGLGKERQEAAMADYVTEQRHALRMSEEMARKQGIPSSAASMHIANYMQASTNIAKVRGLLTDKASSDISVHVLIAQLDEAWTRPLPADSVPALPPDTVDGVILAMDLPEPAPVGEDTVHDAPQ